MSNETGLDWLARNVQVWPCGMREVLACYPRNVNALIWSCVSSNAGWITKEQWITRRAELQNKPSWDLSGSWSEYLAQDMDGEWKWLGENPSLGDDHWTADELRSQCKGVVIGDWRDTLEKRPDMHKNPEKIDTSVEHVQKKVKSMHEWFESGDLPPVGIEIEAWFDDGRECWHKANVIGYSLQEERVLAVSLKGTHDRKLVWVHHFRPIRAERDALVEVLTKVKAQGVDIIGVADAILAAGFSRRDK